MSIELAAKCIPYLIVLAVGFSIGINLRGNPPKRTRKKRNQTTPETGQSENK